MQCWVIFFLFIHVIAIEQHNKPYLWAIRRKSSPDALILGTLHSPLYTIYSTQTLSTATLSFDNLGLYPDEIVNLLDLTTPSTNSQLLSCLKLPEGNAEDVLGAELFKKYQDKLSHCVSSDTLLTEHPAFIATYFRACQQPTASTKPEEQQDNTEAKSGDKKKEKKGSSSLQYTTMGSEMTVLTQRRKKKSTVSELLPVKKLCDYFMSTTPETSRTLVKSVISEPAGYPQPILAAYKSGNEGWLRSGLGNDLELTHSEGLLAAITDAILDKLEQSGATKQLLFVLPVQTLLVGPANVISSLTEEGYTVEHLCGWPTTSCAGENQSGSSSPHSTGSFELDEKKDVEDGYENRLSPFYNWETLKLTVITALSVLTAISVVIGMYILCRYSKRRAYRKMVHQQRLPEEDDDEISLPTTVDDDEQKFDGLVVDGVGEMIDHVDITDDLDLGEDEPPPAVVAVQPPPPAEDRKQD